MARTVRGAGVIRSTGEPFSYELRFLIDLDAASVYALQSAVLAVAPKPLPLYVREPEFFARCVTEGGCVVGAWHGDRLIGYAVLHVPLPGEENYGEQLGLPAAEWRHVGHLAGSGIDPHYRGNGLQSRLVDLRSTYAREARYHHLCGEVLPTNAISIQNHLANGYFLKGFKIDRFDLSIYLLHSDVRVEPTIVDEHAVTETRLDDIEAYRSKLSEGLWGFRVVLRDEVRILQYGRFG